MEKAAIAAFIIAGVVLLVFLVLLILLWLQNRKKDKVIEELRISSAKNLTEVYAPLVSDLTAQLKGHEEIVQKNLQAFREMQALAATLPPPLKDPDKIVAELNKLFPKVHS